MKIALATTPTIMPRATWSDYKHHTQLKFLFGFSQFSNNLIKSLLGEPVTKQYLTGIFKG